METTRQSCPQCGATLELPAAAIGRKARCPACQSTFVVAPAAAPSSGSSTFSNSPSSPAPLGTSSGGGTNSGGGAGGGGGTGGGGSGTPAAPPSKPAAPFGGGDKFSMPVDRSEGAVERSGPAVENPYAVRSGMAAAPAVPLEAGELRIQTPNIDAIVSAATAIFTSRWQPLVIGGLIVFGYNIASSVVNQIISAVAGAGGEEFVVAASMLTSFLSSLLGFYLTVGLIRTVLSVARNQPTPVAVMFPSPGTFGRVILTLLIPLLALLGLGAVVAALAAVVYFATGQNDGAGMAAAVVGGLLFGVVYLAMFFLLWPAVYLASDDRASGMAALRTGFEIGITNKLNSFLFFLINMVLGIIGVLTCCIGQIATTPAALLVAGVGYLMMTSQPVSDPNQLPPAVSPPGFSPSSPYGTPS